MKVGIERICVMLLLGGYFLMALYGVSSKSMTYDEGIHLIGGYSFWTLDDFRLHPENGQLSQRMASVPMLTMDTPAIPTDHYSWANRDGWSAQAHYFYDLQTEPIWLIFCGRVVIILITALIGLLSYIYAKRLFGICGGFITLVLFCCFPEILAHGSLITSDMLGAGTFLLSLFALGLVLEKLTLLRICLLGIGAGLLCVSKNHAALLAPVASISLILVTILKPDYLIVWRSKGHRARGYLKTFGMRLSALTVAAILAWTVLWACYGFRFETYNPELPAPNANWDWDYVLPAEKISADLIRFTLNHKLLPEAFLYGVAQNLQNSHIRPSFLMGEYSFTGFHAFFPLALLFKSPIALIALTLLGILCLFIWLKRSGKDLLQKEQQVTRMILTIPLVIFILVYGSVAINSSLNLGLRYMLPVILCGLVLIGGMAILWRRNRVGQIAIASLLTLYVFESATAYPNYLSFFNIAVGGSQNGYKLLVDSSLDWGQDLGALSDWLAENNAAPNEIPVYLGCLGTENPEYLGIDARYLFSAGYQLYYSYNMPRLEPGYYVMSATILQGPYQTVSRPWTEEQNQLYLHSIRELARLFNGVSSMQLLLDKIAQNNPQHWLKVLRSYEQLRDERLRLYLIEQEPVARINNSIFVYRLDEQDLVNAVIYPQIGFPEKFPLRQFKQQIERSANSHS